MSLKSSGRRIPCIIAHGRTPHLATAGRYMKQSTTPSIQEPASTGKAGSPTPSGPIVSTLAGDPFMAELLAHFVGTLPEKVQSLQSLLDENNLAELRTLVHQIKGAAGSYGFKCLTDAAAGAETTIEAESSLEQIKSEVDSLIGLIQRIPGGKATVGDEESARSVPQHDEILP